MAMMADTRVQTAYAGFWRRFGAYLIDAILLAVVGGILNAIVGRTLGNALGTLIFLGYFAYMESSPNQGTIGKMALGIKVTDLDGNPISFGRALGRNAAKFISAIILLIGFIMAAFTARKQALHDMIAGTLVVTK